MRALLTAALCAALALASLSCDTTTSLTGSLDDLEVSLVDGTIGANFMPPTPPDPVVCRLRVRIANASAGATATGIYLPDAQVLRAADGLVYGKIQFAYEWGGRLGPGEADTVVLTKTASIDRVDPTICGVGVHLLLSVRNPGATSRLVLLDSLVFGCVY